MFNFQFLNDKSHNYVKEQHNCEFYHWDKQKARHNLINAKYQQMAFRSVPTILLFRIWSNKSDTNVEDTDCTIRTLLFVLIQKLKNKHTSLKKYTNWAKLIYFSQVLREREEKNKQIFRTPDLVNLLSQHSSTMQNHNNSSSSQKPSNKKTEADVVKAASAVVAVGTVL